MKIKFLIVFIFAMFTTTKISAQSSFDLTGYWGPFQKGNTLLNGFESNISGFNLLRDWGLKISYGSEFANNINSSLYLASLSKNIEKHTFSLRYTPGYQKEFVFESPVSIILDSSSTQSLNSKYTYKELFGISYSYQFSSRLNAGFTIRFFDQEFSQEEINSIIKVDTIYLSQSNNVKKMNFWKTDFGINYFLTNNFSISVFSNNLFRLEESSSSQFEDLSLSDDKTAIFSFSYSPFYYSGLNFFYETDNSFQAGLNSGFSLFNGNIGVSFSAFHDEMQTPFIAGIVPAVSFSNEFFGITLSGVKYFSKRNTTAFFDDFSETGIKDIINNRFSFDKAVLTLTFTLNTLSEQKVKFLSLNVVNNIYPSLKNNSLGQMFAVGKILNLTDDLITVKPSISIEGMSKDNFKSPEVRIKPNGTEEVIFYAFVPGDFSKKESEISYADFYLSTSTAVNAEEQFDDEVQKAVLIHGVNAWNGKVSNLNYFIHKDMSFSIAYSKKLLSSHKAELDALPNLLSDFYAAKIIFNEIVDELSYVSDPRASADYVQYPEETIEVKGGDCDDLSVLYSSLLEAAGIQTALIDYKPESGIGHVSVMFNTGLLPVQAKLISNNDNKYFIRENKAGESEVWIAIETTSLTNFNSAWELGSKKFNDVALTNLGLAKNKVEIIDVE